MLPIFTQVTVIKLTVANTAKPKKPFRWWILWILLHFPSLFLFAALFFNTIGLCLELLIASLLGISEEATLMALSNLAIFALITCGVFLSFSHSMSKQRSTFISLFMSAISIVVLVTVANVDSSNAEWSNNNTAIFKQI